MLKKIRQHSNEKGFSLLEVIASILILSLIVMSIISIFIMSSKTVQKSNNIIDATYYAQNNMEEIFDLSSKTTYSSSSINLVKNGWTKLQSTENTQNFRKTQDSYTVILMLNKMETNTSLITVLITISPQNRPSVTESQMETIILWEN